MFHSYFSNKIHLTGTVRAEGERVRPVDRAAARPDRQRDHEHAGPGAAAPEVQADGAVARRLQAQHRRAGEHQQGDPGGHDLREPAHPVHHGGDTRRLGAAARLHRQVHQRGLYTFLASRFWPFKRWGLTSCLRTLFVQIIQSEVVTLVNHEIKMINSETTEITGGAN